VVPDPKPQGRPKMQKFIDAITRLAIRPTVLSVAKPSLQIQLQFISKITEDDNRDTQIENKDDFDIGPTIQPGIRLAI
jgi:hypothetical protein